MQPTRSNIRIGNVSGATGMLHLYLCDYLFVPLPVCSDTDKTTYSSTPSRIRIANTC